MKPTQASHILCFDFRRGFGGVATACICTWEQDAEAGRCWAQERGLQLSEWWWESDFFENIPKAALSSPLPEGLVLNAWCVTETEAEAFSEDFDYNFPKTSVLSDRLKLDDLLACGWRALGWDISYTGLDMSYLYTYSHPWPGAQQHLRHRLNAVGLLDSYEECLEIIKVTDFSRYDPVDYIPVQLISTLGRAQA